MPSPSINHKETWNACSFFWCHLVHTWPQGYNWARFCFGSHLCACWCGKGPELSWKICSHTCSEIKYGLHWVLIKWTNQCNPALLDWQCTCDHFHPENLMTDHCITWICDFCDGIDYTAFLLGYISLWYSEMQFIDGTAAASEDLPCIFVGFLII